MTKTIDEILGDAISFALLDGQNQIHDLKDGRSTGEEITVRMEKSVAYHKDKAKASLLELIKEAEPKAPTEARHNDKFDTVYDAAYTNGVNAYSEQISNLFNKEEKEESNDFI